MHHSPVLFAGPIEKFGQQDQLIHGLEQNSETRTTQN